MFEHDVASADAARVALPARSQRPDRDALAGTDVPRAVGPHGLHDPGELVSLDARVPLQPELAVEVVEVRSAEADGLRADEHLAVLRLACVRHVCDPHRPRGLGDGGLHPDSSPMVSDSRRRYALCRISGRLLSSAAVPW